MISGDQGMLTKHVIALLGCKGPSERVVQEREGINEKIPWSFVGEGEDDRILNRNYWERKGYMSFSHFRSIELPAHRGQSGG
ncbi:hypothetical protein CEXT_759621 [Caerostris extrusa]|uniref:Uncharacterized protein n=1 Tax=Caerostris extrusa TaxID=172846 RepID=A0AAV4NVY3_CAEEX|nr:hypothetical protein CEXT_759621 [Caerostris extrusa]